MFVRRPSFLFSDDVNFACSNVEDPAVSTSQPSLADELPVVGKADYDPYTTMIRSIATICIEYSARPIGLEKSVVEAMVSSATINYSQRNLKGTSVLQSHAFQMFSSRRRRY